MERKQKALLAACALASIAIGAAAVGATTAGAQNGEAEVQDADDSNEGPDVAITGTDLDRASAIALEVTGEGRVTDTEIEDEESYYEVEVTLDNGSEVDIQLDEAFNFVGTD